MVSYIFSFRRVDENALSEQEHSAYRRRARSDVSSLRGIRRYRTLSETESNFSVIGETAFSKRLGEESSQRGSIITTGSTMRVIAQDKITPPGRRRRQLRDVIMILLASNFCLWVFMSLEGIGFDVKLYQDAYYGSQVWTIISMICRPLNIFFRMHSAACLFEVWSFA